jgi:ribonucleoside-diphosphate reductase alpha chain
MSELLVRKRNGKTESFDVNKINIFLERCCEGVRNVSASEIAIDAQITFRDKIPTSEIDQALELTARAKIWKHPNYGKVASRIIMSCLYKEIIGESVDHDTFEADYRSKFIKNIKRGVKSGIIDKRMLAYDLKFLADCLVISRDDEIDYIGIKNLADRYFLKDTSGKLLETPQAFYMRIAMGLCLNDPTMVLDFYNMYSQHLASPSTPTLFNSGTTHPQLSSCYLSMIEDSVDGIFDGLWQEARKSKYAGGLGFHMGGIRSTNSKIVGTNGKSSGLIPWMKIYNDMLVAVNQGGKRPGSGCAYIEPWHKDVYEFVDVRKNTGDDRIRCRDLQIALWIPDLFMERVEADADWTLFCPRDCPELNETYGSEFRAHYEKYETTNLGKKVRAKDLWKHILRALFETSHPWICFKDRSNERYTNKHMGIVHGSNLCTEIILRNKAPKYKDGVKTEHGLTAVCTLASICLPNHMELVDEVWMIDYPQLQDTVEKLIRSLDNVIDINFYPTEEARIGATADRPLGMGTIGWVNVLARLGIAADSEEAVQVASELTEFISYHAILTSHKLSQDRGSYPTFSGSLWSNGVLPIDSAKDQMAHLGIKAKFDWEPLRELVSKGMRNSNLLAIAPNASIAYILGFSQSVEPNLSIAYAYENLSSITWLVDKDFVAEMEREGLWSTEFADKCRFIDGDTSLLPISDKQKAIYKGAFKMNQFGLIKTNAARQVWIDQAISFNLYNAGTSIKHINDMYFAAWKDGLKTTYYLRNVRANKAEQIESEQKTCSISDPTCESCHG